MTGAKPLQVQLVGDAIIAVLIFAMAANRLSRLAALLVDEVVQAVGIIGSQLAVIDCGADEDDS